MSLAMGFREPVVDIVLWAVTHRIPEKFRCIWEDN